MCTDVAAVLIMNAEQFLVEQHHVHHLQPEHDSAWLVVGAVVVIVLLVRV